MVQGLGRKQLMVELQDGENGWVVLAKFWSEMILYVALFWTSSIRAANQSQLHRAPTASHKYIISISMPWPGYRARVITLEVNSCTCRNVIACNTCSTVRVYIHRDYDMYQGT
jgi:hypothetical protein